jgi:stage V sporulation protein D (sporulation-specific penicillin-binding protein)
MPFEYSSYIDAIDGYNLTTTIDSTVQSFLEEELAATVEKHNVTNRACGIVMDVNTGAILAMAVSSPFDLNDPWQLDETSQSRLDRLAEEGYDEKSDEYNDLSRELLTTMWSNKAVTESYIPGSTFKIITSSMALEEKVVSLTESVNCPGHKTLFGHTIHCHETKGHGSLSFSQGLQQSCNVWFMTLGERIGVERYQDYVEIFGYRDKTGIDLPGEGNSIFASQMTELDLAIYAFGQNFTVTPIQQITAVASVANGGELLSPYLVEKISDNAGNVIYAHETEQKRETISEDTCKIISQILEEGVSGDGGAKNAYVAGYRVAAKTGTSEKKERECPKCGSTGVPKTVGEDEIVYVCSICKFTADVDDFPVSEKYICSTVAYAPADDPQIAVLIMVDEPTRGSLYGSTVAAPYVRNVLKNSLPYLGVEARYTQEELEKMRIKVANYKNRSVEGAISSITDAGLRYKVIGEGEYVTSQLPEAGTYIEEASGTIVLYASSSPNNTVTVPDLNGMVAATANQALINLNLNVRIEGADSYLSGTGYKVISQSVKAGEKVAPGTVITLTFKKSGS